MAQTIFIPATKWKFKEAVAKKLLSLGDVKDHGKYFWEVFTEVSGYTYDLDIHQALGRDLHQLQPPANDFEAAVREEFLRLVGETEQEEDSSDKFSGGDFQHVFLETWMHVAMDIMIAPAFANDSD